MVDILREFLATGGIAAMTWQDLVMIGIALFFLYLAIYKKYEPYLLLPIAFGMLLANLPLTGLMTGPLGDQPGNNKGRAGPQIIRANGGPQQLFPLLDTRVSRSLRHQPVVWAPQGAGKYAYSSGNDLASYGYP